MQPVAVLSVLCLVSCAAFAADEQHTRNGTLCSMMASRAMELTCEFVGNPNARYWPDASAEHTFARTVWDMQTARIGDREEAIYFGGGDWELNQ